MVMIEVIDRRAHERMLLTLPSVVPGGIWPNSARFRFKGDQNIVTSRVGEFQATCSGLGALCVIKLGTFTAAIRVMMIKASFFITAPSLVIL